MAVFSIVLFLFITSIVIAWDKIVAGRVPFISLPTTTIEELISHIRLKSSDVIFDLGCGDGRVLLIAAKKQPKAQYVGIEKAIWPYILARYNCRKYKNIHIQWGDINYADISGASFVFIYLLPHLISQIEPKLVDKKVLSVEYGLTNNPTRSIKIKNKTALVSKFYLYE